MGISIDLSGSKISDDARVMNNITIDATSDVDLNLKKIDVCGRAVVLDNLNINQVLEKLSQKVKVMDKNSDEYPAVQKILDERHWNKKDFSICIIKHLSEFAQGVLAGVLANLVSNQVF